MVASLKKSVRWIARRWFGVDLIRHDTFGFNIVDDIARLVPVDRMNVIFDIGANRGDATIEFAQAFPRAKMYSFEPDQATMSELRRRTNRFQERVKVFNFGIGAKTESRDLTINRSSGGNSFLDISPDISQFAEGDWTEPVTKTQAEIQTLDHFCAVNGIESIDLLKVDTQGFEMEVLKGGSLVIVPSRTKLIHIEVLFIELYKNQAFFDQVYQELTNRGFRLVGLYNPFYKTEEPHYLLWCDALFVGKVD
ncbi:MAG: FkbM family methyltransferase [Cyclobacteriaceae bacterium]|nr:FkbM family methyltransferase [Cyclobacteriaceae bacterium]